MIEACSAQPSAVQRRGVPPPSVAARTCRVRREALGHVAPHALVDLPPVGQGGQVVVVLIGARSLLSACPCSAVRGALHRSLDTAPTAQTQVA